MEKNVWIIVLTTILLFYPFQGVIKAEVNEDIVSFGDSFKRLQEEDPKTPVAWEYLGVSYLLQEKDSDKAIESFKKAVEIDKNYFMGYVRLGQVYKNLGMKDEAKKNFKKALPLIDGEIRRAEAKLNTFKGKEREVFKKVTLTVYEKTKKECEKALGELE